jgi:hypothetical protein
MEQEKARKLVILAIVASGIAAACLMYRRGESLMGIARKAIANPLGALASEVETAWTAKGTRASTVRSLMSEV